MQTIRIYAKTGGLVAIFSGPPHRVETPEMRAMYPESHYYWLR